MNLCEFTESLWKIYMLSSRPEDLQRLEQSFADDVVVIGTGRLEYYECLQAFSQAFQREAVERADLRISIRELWCKEKKLADTVSLVYGKIHVCGSGIHENVSVDMDTRFSMIYRLENGAWKIAHAHQSLPYNEQRDGEFYPKSLMEQEHQERQRADRMEQLARTDRLTGLLNHHAFFEDAQELLTAHPSAYCAVADLDDFKSTNDRYGHLTGDAVLQEVGRILCACMDGRGIAGRVGGDEFAFLYPNITEAELEQIVASILGQIRRQQEHAAFEFPNISIGITPVRQVESLHKAFGRADRILYDIKRDGKSQYRIEK